MNQPQFQFRGVWTPAELFFLYRDKKINPADMVFLSVIDSLTQARGRGCWASNRWFADFTGLHISTVKQIIRKLVDLGLVERNEEEGRRTLRVIWAAEVVPERVRGSTGEGTGQYLRSRYLDNIEDSSAFPQGDKSMATFKQKEKDGKCIAFDYGTTDIIQSTLQKVRKIFRPYSKEKWANSIRLLRKDLSNDADRIVRVLEWWRENSKAKGVPTILNAMQFRKHFIWLEERCDKDIGKTVAVDAKTKVIAKRVVMKGWPGKSRDQVESAIQLSRESVNELLITIKCMIKRQAPNSHYLNFLIHLRGKIGDTDTFAENWMMCLHKRYAGWK